MYFKNRYSVVTLQTGKIKCLNKDIIIFASVVVVCVLSILSRKLLYWFFSCHLYKWQKGDWVLDYWFVCLYFGGIFFPFFFFSSVLQLFHTKVNPFQIVVVVDLKTNI